MLMGLSVGRKKERMGVLVKGLEQPIFLTEDNFLNLSRTITGGVVKMEKYPLGQSNTFVLLVVWVVLRGQKDV